MKKLIKPTLTILALLIVGSLAYFYSWVTKPPETSYNTSPPVEEIKPPTVDELFKLTNEERKKVGVKPLKLDSELNKSAQQKADDMTKYKYFDHSNPLTGGRGFENVIKYSPLCLQPSENLTQTNNANNNDSAHAIKAWMDSTPHRKAMLDGDMDVVGFGISGDSVVQHLCDIE